MFPLLPANCAPWRRAILAPALLAVACVAPADDTRRAGRYLDRTVLVHDAARLNPLRQVADLRFSARISIAGALRTALAGTGYRLLAPDAHPHPGTRALLLGRLAMPHHRFDGRRIDAVIAAIVGVGRGYGLEVDHGARLVRVVPARPGLAR